MSNPSARLRLGADVGPTGTPTSGPGAKGSVCPKCRDTFPEGSLQCPADKTPLIRVSELVGAELDPMIGRSLDERYTLLAKLGAGSMGTVYRARQHAIGRNVAVKILRSDRALDETSKARFLREARANSLLASPNTVTVFDFGQSEQGEFYLAMELLEGESLGQRLAREKRLPVDIAVESARQALRSLAEAHAKGIIHRDLKPDNLFFARVMNGEGISEHEEVVKVLDFGIAKMLRDDDALPMSAVETQAGTVFGTPRYMSPEQAQGKALDLRSDLYSLAVILYQMLTGRPPFTDSDAIVVMARHIKTAPKAPREACPEACIPPELEAALLRALAKDPKARPASAEIMSHELARALDLLTAVTSGVRISLPGSVRPPPGSVPPPQLGDVAADAPPTIANAIPRGRLATIGAVLVALFVVSIGATLLVLRQRAPAQGAATPGAYIPPAPPRAALPAPAPADTIEVEDTPSVSPDTLPRASGKPSRPVNPTRTSPKPASSGARAAPGPSASGTPYGLFE